MVWCFQSVSQLQRKASGAAVRTRLHRRHRLEAAEKRAVAFLWWPDGEEANTGREGAGRVSKTKKWSALFVPNSTNKTDWKVENQQLTDSYLTSLIILLSGQDWRRCVRRKPSSAGTTDTGLRRSWTRWRTETGVSSEKTTASPPREERSRTPSGTGRSIHCPHTSWRSSTNVATRSAHWVFTCTLIPPCFLQ